MHELQQYLNHSKNQEKETAMALKQLNDENNRLQKELKAAIKHKDMSINLQKELEQTKNMLDKITKDAN